MHACIDLCTSWYTQWRRPGAEFGGTENFSADPRFLNDVFLETNVHFRSKNFHLLVIDQIFQIFPFFSQILPIFAMLNVVFDPFLTRKTHFLLCSYFHAHPTTSLNIGGTNAWAVPSTSNFRGAVPPLPYVSPPLYT